MATTTYKMNREDQSWELTRGTGSAVTSGELLLEFEDDLTIEETKKALVQMIKHLEENPED